MLLFPLQLQNMPILISCKQRVSNQAFKIMALAICSLLFCVSQKHLGTLAFCYVLTHDSLETSPRFGEEITGSVPPSPAGFWIKRYMQK